ncbi:hypothetical protein C7212DRAFT_359975 [Tuber magnatum]|uniref:Uncharacterized protein n=1 Tax=Tuber magnatum TaxID=42249 RepID=A0A317SGI3_9PEZI|nr:hypothetical protein C7212DRAFT_359975 [Tuber magnatum]
MRSEHDGMGGNRRTRVACLIAGWVTDTRTDLCGTLGHWEFSAFATEQIIRLSVCIPVTSTEAINWFGLVGTFLPVSILFVRVCYCGAVSLAPLCSMIAISRECDFRDLQNRNKNGPLFDTA